MSAPRIGRIGDWDGSASSGSSRSASQANRRVRTLGDAGASPSAGQGNAHGSDDEDGEDEGQRWFAGGERSGLSIENPNRPNPPGGNVVRDLLRRAAEAGPQAGFQQQQSRGPFSGGGHTLGSDDVESSFIPDPHSDETSPVIRNITFWRDGFSIEDGDLLRYDDPVNAQILDQINSGQAPPSVLNVLPNQSVELRVARRLDEDYAPSQGQTAKLFSGSGNRLGSPVPSFSTSTNPPVPGAFPSAAPSSSTTESVRTTDSINARFSVDQSQPTTSIQLRLADGTRMVCRMNLTHTVGDIRNFINASNPENRTRGYTIGTTFPNRTLENDKESIKDAGLANSVIVQRWI